MASIQERIKMRVCYFGTYEGNYPRNRIIIEGLRRSKVEVVECHVPVWELTRHKAGLFLSGKSLFRLPFRLISDYLKLLMRYAKVGGYDVMIVGYIGQLDMFLAKVLAKARHRPLVFNPLVSLSDTLIADRQSVAAHSLKAKLLYLLDREACRCAEAILLDTKEHIAYFHSKFAIPWGRLHRVFVGADEAIFSPVDTKEGNKGEFHVLFYGKLIPLQGVPYIVKAAKLLESNGEVKFQIIGSGQLGKDIHDLSKRLEVRNISFLNWVRYEDLPTYIGRADVCLGIFGDTDKSRRVIPNKVFQALAMKKAVITGNSPAARELLVDKENVLFCEMANPEALVEAILLLKRDVSLRRKIARNGYELFKQRCCPKVIGEETQKILQVLIKERARRKGSM